MWVTRDVTNELWVFSEKPIRNKYVLGCWGCEGVCGVMKLDSELFPDLKWEDEPIEVELIEKEHIEDTKEIQCTFCDKTFSYSVEDMISVKSLVGNYKMVTCPHCNSKNFL